LHAVINAVNDVDGPLKGKPSSYKSCLRGISSILTRAFFIIENIWLELITSLNDAFEPGARII
jgi:hypothetical protein